MNREAAEKLIQATFEQPFDEDRYRYFVRELLNHLDESKAHTQAGAYIADAFKKHIRSFKRVGTYTDPAGQEIDILIVYLQKETALDRARTMQRNFVAHHLKNRSKEAALVAYASPDLGDWRFSFVRLEYQLQTDEATGKVKLDESLTPSRRYSFLVGANEPNHTAQQQLISILAEDAHNPGLETLEKAFDIEVVTKQFFEDYKERYLELVEAIQQLTASQPQAAAIFSEDGLTIANFAKRLMGQIVFLYFLQKKGWLGVREGQPGPQDFLRQLYDRHWIPYQNFFNQILEPLFYDALAVEHPNNYFELLDCQIPFLNGGLFEPPPGYDWRSAPLPLPNAVFGKIFDTFDLYNFTVREDEPLEKEVAVDPEMLGKVFERLLEVGDRKSKGAFYTPREIVHYMCQESLINYLDTALNLRPDPLAKVDPVQGDMFAAPQPKQTAMTALKYDPIVPKGDIEFLIRMGEFAQEYEQAKQAGTKSYADHISAKVHLHAAKIDRALADVKICDPAIGSGAFPVGMMKEIVRTREVLTTYLPSPAGTVEDRAEGAGHGGDETRTPYAFKRHAIQHSLYGVDIDPGAVDIAKLRLWLSLVVDEDDFTQVKPLPNLDYKIVTGNSLLGYPYERRGLEKLEALKDQFFNENDPTQKHTLRAQIDRELADIFKNTKKSLGYQVTVDFKINFSEVFRDKGGFDIVIGNPPYVDSETMVNISPLERDRLASVFKTARGNWDLYIPFWELAISLANDEATSVLITPNKWLSIGYGNSLRNHSKPYVYRFVDYSHFRVFENAGVFPVVVFMRKRSNRFIHVERFLDGHKRVYSNQISAEFLTKFEKWGVLLSQNLDLIIKLIGDKEQLDKLCFVASAFTVSEAYEIKKYLRDQEISDETLYFKFINTGTIDPYISLWGIKDTTYIKKKYKYPTIARDDIKKYFYKRYIQNLQEKIILSGIRHFEAYYDEFGDWVAAKSTVVLREFRSDISPLLLLGILNSKLIKFYLRECYSSLGMDGGINFSPGNVSEIPIAIGKKETQLKIIELVESILTKTTKNPLTDIQELTLNIDMQVYQLYDLTPEEIALVEASVNK